MKTKASLVLWLLVCALFVVQCDKSTTEPNPPEPPKEEPKPTEKDPEPDPQPDPQPGEDEPQPKAFTAGGALCMAGDGAEKDQAFRYLDNSIYEIFTHLEAGKTFAFSATDPDTGTEGWRFTLNAAQKLIEMKEGTQEGKVSVTGEYRITLDFSKMEADLAHIDRVVLRHCNKDAWDAELSYKGAGEWEIKNYNVRISKLNGNLEERYKFIMFEDGVATHWGMAGTFGSQPTLDREDYFDLKKAESKQWAGAFKYAKELVDNQNFFRWFVNVSLRMQATGYTHSFSAPRDGALMYPATPSAWASAADSCTFILVDRFLNKDRGTFKQNAHHITGQNNSTLYWQQAYPMHTVLFSYERIKASNASLAAQYKGYFEKFVKNRGNNYATTSDKPSPYWNNFTDDMAWHCLLQLHAYEVFGDEAYYQAAKTLYDQCILAKKRIVEDEEGWGLLWRINYAEDNGKDTRNACTNTPVMIAACKLHMREKDKTDKYLQDAVKLFNFMTKTGNRVKANGAVSGTPLTYTQGTWIEATRLLYHITGEQKYLDRATTCTQYTLSPDGSCVMAAFGLLRGEGTSNDQANFKGGLIPYLVNYANDEAMPAATRQEVKTFLMYNANVLWFHSMVKDNYPQSFVNFSWEVPYRVEGNPGSLGACSSGAALLEGVTRLK